MEKYNDLNQCPKCGNKAKSFYLTAELANERNQPQYANTIERRCARCQYVWYELPLDISGKVFGLDVVVDENMPKDEAKLKTNKEEVKIGFPKETSESPK